VIAVSRGLCSHFTVANQVGGLGNTVRRFHNIRRAVTGLAFSADGRTLMACARDRVTLAVWDLATGSYRRWHPYADDVVTSIAFSPDGKWLAVGSTVGMVLPYDYATLKYNYEFHPGGFGEWRPVREITFARMKHDRGFRLAMAADYLQIVTLPDANDDAEIEDPLPDVGDGYTRVAFAPSGQYLATVGGRSVVTVWDVWARKSCADETFLDEPRSVCFAADGTTIAVAVGSEVQLRRATDLGLLCTCTHAGGTVERVAPHPTQNIIVAVGADKTVRFWDAGTGGERRTYDWNIGRATAIAFAPDGLTCAVGGSKGQIVVWDVDL
jgi:WD40 repeat protein